MVLNRGRKQKVAKGRDGRKQGLVRPINNGCARDNQTCRRVAAREHGCDGNYYATVAEKTPTCSPPHVADPKTGKSEHLYCANVDVRRLSRLVLASAPSFRRVNGQTKSLLPRQARPFPHWTTLSRLPSRSPHRTRIRFSASQRKDAPPSSNYRYLLGVPQSPCDIRFLSSTVAHSMMMEEQAPGLTLPPFGDPTFAPALFSLVRDAAPLNAPVDPVIIQAVLLCLIAGNKHLILRTAPEDVSIAAKAAVAVSPTIFFHSESYPTTNPHALEVLSP